MARYQLVLDPCPDTLREWWHRIIAEEDSTLALHERSIRQGLAWNQAYHVDDTKLNKRMSKEEFLEIVRKQLDKKYARSINK